MGDTHVGLQARLMCQALRKLAGTLNRTDTICLFTNQLREKIGVMFGSPETTPGGRALKFYSSVRLDIRRIETLKDGVEAIGNRVRVKVVKNKVAPPFKQAEFDIIYGTGISWEGTVLDAALERKVVHEVGLVLQLRRRAARPGPAQRDRVPARASGRHPGDPRARSRRRSGPSRSRRHGCCRRRAPEDAAKAREEVAAEAVSEVPQDRRSEAVDAAARLLRARATARGRSSTQRLGGNAASTPRTRTEALDDARARSASSTTSGRRRCAPSARRARLRRRVHPADLERRGLPAASDALGGARARARARGAARRGEGVGPAWLARRGFDAEVVAAVAATGA